MKGALVITTAARSHDSFSARGADANCVTAGRQTVNSICSAIVGLIHLAVVRDRRPHRVLGIRDGLKRYSHFNHRLIVRVSDSSGDHATTHEFYIYVINHLVRGEINVLTRAKIGKPIAWK